MQRLRIVLLALVAAGLALFYLPASDGHPLLTVDELKSRTAGLRRAVGGGSSGSESVRTIYKWRGPDGTWHYSNVRPADHPEAQEVQVPLTWVEGSGASAPPASSSAPPRDAADLLRTTREVEKQTRGRNAELERMMNEMNR